ncbi:ISAon1 family transposase N-terminal region protein [Sinomicrobium sp. M5D2P17]
MDNYLDFIKMVLPSFLVDHFDLIKSEKHGEVMHLYFEERNTPPKENSFGRLMSKGFHKEITIQDFPLRGHRVFLHVKRRRWLDQDSGNVIERDWNLVAQGTRMTKEFAAFLKEISRY